MAPQNVFVHCAETLLSSKVKHWLLILIYEASKKLYLVIQVIQGYHNNQFVVEYSRFSELIALYVSL